MRIDRSVAVGLEIGGGQTTVALIGTQGQICQREQARTLRGRPVAATLEPYVRTLDGLLARARADNVLVRGIGISVPGSVDYNSRRPQLVSILPALNNFPLCDFFETRYQLPTHLHADVDAAMLGEQRFGAGKGIARLLYLSVNAVVGAALVRDGQLERSTQQSIGHICHLPIATSGPRCSCGKRGCINTLISLDAMQRMVQRALRRGDETTLIQRFLNGEHFSLQLLAEEAARGDSVAQQIYSEVVRWLCTAIGKYLDLFDPHRLILAGSLLHGNNHLLEQVRATLPGALKSTSARVCSMVEIVPACLGRDVTLVGAVVPLT